MKRSPNRTASTTKLLGRCNLISALHCGHSTLLTRFPARRRELGASMSAIQSSRHFSCATSTQGQGDRHSDVVASSSVSSLKQIQHLRGSSSSCRGACCGGVPFCVSGAGLDDCVGRELRRSVCESTDCWEKLLERAASSWCEEDSRLGECLC